VINLDFSLAIAIYSCALLLVILFIWVFKRKAKDKDLRLDAKYLWFCSICSYTYINTKEDVISACPRCGSYNKKG